MMNQKNWKSQSPAGRMKRLETEVAALERAAVILQREFGTNPRRADELGYGMLKGIRELRRELLTLRKQAGLWPPVGGSGGRRAASGRA